MDRGLSGRGQPAPLEFRPGNDVGSVAPLHHSRHRPGFGRGAVGVGQVGPGLAMGDSDDVGHGAGLAGAGRGGGAVAGSQATHCAGVADRCRLRGRLPGADLSDALVALHCAGVGPNPALSTGSRGGAGAAGRGRLLRAEPSFVTLARRVRTTHGGDHCAGDGVRGEQLLFDGDVLDVLARQSRTTVCAERPPRSGCRASALERAAAGPGSRPAGPRPGRLARKPGRAPVRPASRSPRIRLDDNAIEDAGPSLADWWTRR